MLHRIRSAWIRRVSNHMAGGAPLREDFQNELDRFYELLIQTVETGDPSRVDPLLSEWATAPTQTALKEGENTITGILQEMQQITFEVARQELAAEQSLELLAVVLPVFNHACDRTFRLEMDARVAYFSHDLSAAQEKLERLDRSKSSFISVAAHELKTPLTLIEGYTAMMRDLVRPEGQAQLDSLIEGINNGIRRLRLIVDDMIDVSLIDNQMLDLTYQPVWLNQVLGLIHTELLASIHARKLKFELHPFPGMDQMLFGDPERLYQAFRNILSNAIKFTPDRGRIVVDGRPLPGFLEITVADSGIGIAPRDQERIFEKFSQLGDVSLHSSGKTKFKGGGPGLGLPIARGIIEAHGGTIWVESEGQDETRCPGATFHILLPARTEPPDPKLAKLFGRPGPAAPA